MDKSIRQQTWIKNWSGRWSACFCSFYGYIYSKGLKTKVGRNIKYNLLIYEPEVSANYLSKEEITKFGNFLASLVTKDEQLSHKWSKEVIARTNTILKYIKILDNKSSFEQRDFLRLRTKVFNHVPTNFFVKKVADYLPMNLLEKNLKDFSHVRTYTESVYNETDRILNKIFSSISVKTNFLLNILRTLTHTEIEKYLKTGKLPGRQLLTKRQNGFAIFYLNGREKIIVGADFKKLKRQITAKLASSAIKGTSAYPGITKGRVKIIFDPAKAKDFKQGDILITGMTRPEFLPIMKKAAGFITDAGGILSHAAIVAREMKKPCIVGAEVATKVFKDGDMVEVDANKGIVRKLS